MKWLKLGDRNSKFFHNTLKVRYNTNHIIYMVDDNGEIVCDGKAIGELFCNYYMEFFNGAKAVKYLGKDVVRKFVT